MPDYFSRNKAYAKPGPYTTKLAPEQGFLNWVQSNKVPWQDTPNADYDMRGYYQALQSGTGAQDPTTMHFSDTYKTPYHQSFSAESQYATPGAPSWKGNQLVMPNGTVVYDEAKKAHQIPQRGAP